MVNVKRITISKMIYTYIVIILATKLIPLEKLPIVALLLGKSILLFRLFLVTYKFVDIYKHSLPIKQFFALFVLLVLSILEYAYTNEWQLFDTFFVLISFEKYIDYRKIYNIIFSGLAIVMISVPLLFFGGISASDFTYYRADGGIRYSFGFSHPNAFAGNLLFLIIFYLLKIDRTKIRPKEIFLIFICGLFTIFIPKSITAGFCIVLISCVLFIKKFSATESIGFIKNRKVKLFVGIVTIFGIISLVYIIAMKGYGEDILANISGTFYSRFIYGQKAIKQYGFSMFGQKVEMINEKMLSLDGVEGEYFNLDCTYFYLPIVKGILPTICYLFWYIKAITLSVKSRNLMLFFILIITSIYAISEASVLTYLGYLFIGAVGYAKNKSNNKEDDISRKSFVKGIY